MVFSTSVCKTLKMAAAFQIGEGGDISKIRICEKPINEILTPNENVNLIHIMNSIGFFFFIKIKGSSVVNEPWSLATLKSGVYEVI